MFGPIHISTLASLHNLVNLYRVQGKVEKSKDTYLRALQGYRKLSLQDTHPLLTIAHNLGIVCRKFKKFEQSESMYLLALQAKRTRFGKDHISTLNTKDDLGLLRLEQKRINEAEELFQRALKGYADKYGWPNRPSPSVLVTNILGLNDHPSSHCDLAVLTHKAATYKRLILRNNTIPQENR
ncbi:hypothetical protein ETB97_007700 [Aspergillus alliaceus]|uniref:Kinesin light chain n=1 Tax=Petromyces alliaceus TaxID=209559 RepID=A0A8H6E1T7_PETAA|nr:hypothetical protein ETB97_007700 [Aspergillus burnettii]